MFKVLVACEESQEVANAFRLVGCDAFSCDLQECSGGHPEYHYQGDCLDLIYNVGYHWDLLIAHPPCTDIAVSGARHFAKKIADGRQQKAVDFFVKMVNAPVKHICVENPVCIMSRLYKKPDQIIQPYMFGHRVRKTTCLWLKNLPKLKPTNIVDEGEFKEWTDAQGRRKRQSMFIYSARGDRGKQRSKTFSGIAQAMAEQWLEYLELCG